MSDILKPENASKFFNNMLAQNKVVIVSATYCSYCVKAKSLLIGQGIRFVSLEIDIIPNGREVFEATRARTGSNSVPQIYINKNYIGGYDELLDLYDEKALQRMVEN
ncbi:glutaredoxin [Perkinsela sp. CCAP 1560/4]|nr:glutaredoxin [Perkinsela sp. CCAP 1560/4]|eukprot:KNH08227.1 glutaredoxin [Perkinsela sp. CCAP 1560/4]